MKLKLILKVTTNKNKDVYLKFNIAPSKHLGFINFINLALNLKGKAMLNWKLKLKIEIKKGKNSTKKEFKANLY